MPNMVKQSCARSVVTLLLVGLVTVLATRADASEPPGDKRESTNEAKTGLAQVEKAPYPDAGCESGLPSSLNVSYALYKDALVLRPEVEAVPVTARTTATPVPSAAGPPAPRASTAPMTAGEKFGGFVRRTFLSPGAYGQSVFSGLFNELRDKKDKPDFDTGDYFGDAMTRAARSYAFRVTSGFFEKFAYPTIFKQDPRYHRSDKSSTGGKIGYAISRLFVTQGDRSGDQPNVSFLLGAATAAAASNLWEREERRDFSHAARRFGIHLGLVAFSNILREFIGGQ